MLLALTPFMRYLFLPPITTLGRNNKTIIVCVRFISNRSKQHAGLWVTHLSSDGDLVVGFKPKRTLALVGVVKGDGHRGLGDASLSVFVDQVLEVGCSHLKGSSQQGRLRISGGQ